MGQYVINKDVRIHYSVEGKGKIPLVMISGFGGDMNLWKYNVSGLSRLFKIIRIDNRGSGESDKPEYPYRMEMFSSDVKCVLDDLGIKEAYILGASMGGLITQQVYKDYPEVVKGLFLICTIAGIPVQLQRLVNKVIKNTFYNLTSSLVVPRIVGAFNAFVERKKMSIGSFAENFELPEVDMKIINLLLGKE